jgi:glycogen debranching enzyme
MGPFVRAYLRAHDGSEVARARARVWLQHLLDTHRNQEAGLGHISEVADGDAPHRPGGCIAQAWSLAELLRAEEAVSTEGI